MRAKLIMATCAVAALGAATCGRTDGAGGQGAAVQAVPVPDGVVGRPLGVRGAEIGWRDRSGGTAGAAIERRGPGETGWRRVGERPAGTYEWLDWGLEPDSTYSYRVVALVDGVASAPTIPLEVRTGYSEIPDPVVEVFDARAVSPGVTLFDVVDREQLTSLTAVMAVDEAGDVVWQFEDAGLVVTETEPLANGETLVQRGFSTIVVDERCDLVDAVTKVYVHHDVDVLPWGNMLAITSPSIGPDSAWTRPHGVPDPAVRTQEEVVEIDPVTQEVVNTILFDDLVPREHACDACLGGWLFNHADWLHLNAVDLDPEEMALYVSVRNLDRIYRLSYPDGEIEWVMGDGGDFGEGLFSHQHNPTRIGEGRMLVFDNGLHADWLALSASRVVEIEYDPEAGAARIVWQYDGPPAFFTEVMGDASRLENGNTLVVDSLGHRIVEVSPGGLPVMEIRLAPPYIAYKAHRVPWFL